MIKIVKRNMPKESLKRCMRVRSNLSSLLRHTHSHLAGVLVESCSQLSLVVCPNLKPHLIHLLLLKVKLFAQTSRSLFQIKHIFLL